MNPPPSKPGMLQLTLIRHAKSSWKDADLSDFDRPLNKRGRRNAPLMGGVIRELGLRFDRIVSSPAKRAITTARLIAAELDYPKNRIETHKKIYLAGVAELLQRVHALDPHQQRIALVGHNPGLTEFCNYLSGEQIDNLPTCAVAVLEFELDDWRAVFRNTGKLVHYEYPKKHEY